MNLFHLKITQSPPRALCLGVWVKPTLSRNDKKILVIIATDRCACELTQARRIGTAYEASGKATKRAGLATREVGTSSGGGEDKGSPRSSARLSSSKIKRSHPTHEYSTHPSAQNSCTKLATLDT
ncbi:hypothetical protein M758_1G231300 [Ceratodon purpureus]|nr:hypothetical protein M758_1G231300 [Ceratodon purpureus]